MYNITNYSIFFISELQIRFYYILFDLLFTFFICLYYFNNLVLFLLQPIEDFNLDLNSMNLNIIFFNIFNLLFSYDYIVLEDILSFNTINNTFDFMSSIEINISNTNFLYFKVLTFFTLFFLFPNIFYQLYLFIKPSLYFYENGFINKYLFLLCLFYIFFFFKYNYLFSIIVNLNYNNYQEFNNYEFDIEFIFIDYFYLYIYFFILLFINFITMIFKFIFYFKIPYFKKINLYKFIFFFMNFLFFINIFILFLFIITYYLFCYIHFLFNI